MLDDQMAMTFRLFALKTQQRHDSAFEQFDHLRNRALRIVG